jgi:transcriptional regulator with XRE-family HTH domain
LIDLPQLDPSQEIQRQVGKRMRAAREAHGVSETDAAMMLGYTQPSNLSAIEHGTRPATVPILLKAAEIYGTSVDYLVGRSDSIDRDPAAGLSRYIGGRISADVQRLISQLSEVTVDMARGLLPSMGDGTRLASAALELVREVHAAGNIGDRAHNAAARTEAQATAYLATVGRARRAMQARVPTAQEAQKMGAPAQLTIGVLEGFGHDDD